MFRKSMARLIVVISTFSIFFFTGSTLFASSIVYDNTVTPTNGFFLGGSSIQYGDEITLGGSDRIITDFQFYYFKLNEAEEPTAIIRFYHNDGQSGAPGTLFYDSGNLPLSAGVGNYSYTLTGLSVLVPENFIWTVEWGEKPFICSGWCSGQRFLVGLSAYNPPAIGLSENNYWSLDYYTSSWVKESGDDIFPYNFGAKITATTIPVSSTFFLVCFGIMNMAFIRGRFNIKAKNF